MCRTVDTKILSLMSHIIFRDMYESSGVHVPDSGSDSGLAARNQIRPRRRKAVYKRTSRSAEIKRAL